MSNVFAAPPFVLLSFSFGLCCSPFPFLHFFNCFLEACSDESLCLTCLFFGSKHCDVRFGLRTLSRSKC